MTCTRMPKASTLRKKNCTLHHCPKFMDQSVQPFAATPGGNTNCTMTAEIECRANTSSRKVSSQKFTSVRDTRVPSEATTSDLCTILSSIGFIVADTKVTLPALCRMPSEHYTPAPRSTDYYRIKRCTSQIRCRTKSSRSFPAVKAQKRARVLMVFSGRSSSHTCER